MEMFVHFITYIVVIVFDWLKLKCLCRLLREIDHNLFCGINVIERFGLFSLNADVQLFLGDILVS